MITHITIHELQMLTDQELGELYQLFTLLLSETLPYSADRRRIAATLETIRHMIGQPRRPSANSRGIR